MGINEFRTYALQTMCEAHLWKIGEEDTFTLKGWTYHITLEYRGANNYPFVLRVNNGSKPMYFQTIGRLFHHIFESRMISY